MSNKSGKKINAIALSIVLEMVHGLCIIDVESKPNAVKAVW